MTARYIHYFALIFSWIAASLMVVHTLIVPHDAQLFFFATVFAIFAGVLLIHWTGDIYLYSGWYLLSTLCLLTAWRLSSFLGAYYANIAYIVAVIAQFLVLVRIAYDDVKSDRNTQKKHTTFLHATQEWHIVFIRLMIGFILVPHFSEKLFAGSSIRQDDIRAFTGMGLPTSQLFVLIAGLSEFGGCLSIACGLLTRLGSFMLATYLLLAAYLGGHFSMGFIWAGPGGGWEYPFLWAVLVFSFAIFGSGSFSLDYELCQMVDLPVWIRWLMGSAHRRPVQKRQKARSRSR